MTIRYTQEEFDKAKSTDFLNLECEVCSKTFQRMKTRIKSVLKGTYYTPLKFCSQKCKGIAQTQSKTKIIKCNHCNKDFREVFFHLNQNKKHYCSVECRNEGSKKQIEIECWYCHKKIMKQVRKFKMHKSHFCSKSCRTKYHVPCRLSGSRSKLEKIIENEFKILYPTLEIHYNNRDAIGSELDIYIPIIKTGIQLNGPTHYVDIYGLEKLERTQKMDKQKEDVCKNKGIHLCIIDVRGLTYYKKDRVDKYINMVKTIIDNKLAEINQQSNQNQNIEAQV